MKSWWNDVRNQHISAEDCDDLARCSSCLCVLHYADGKFQGEAQIGIGEVPVRELLQPRDSVGHGVAVDAQARGRFVQAGRTEHGAQGVEALTLDLGSPD